MAIVTLADYKTFAEIGSNTQDTRLTLILDLVDSLVNTYCNRKFEQATYTEEQVEIINSISIFIDNPPLNSVTTLEYFSQGKVWTVVDAADFLEYSEEGHIEIISNNIVTLGILKPFRVTYSGGFTTIPADLKLAVFDLTTFYHKREKSPRVVQNNTSVTSASDKISRSQMPAHIKRVLDLYRIIQ